MRKLNFEWLYMILCAVMCVNFSSCGDDPVVAPTTPTTQGSGSGNSGNDNDNKGGKDEEGDDTIEGLVTIRLSNNNKIGGGMYYEPNSGIEGKVAFPDGSYSIYLYINSNNNFETTEHYNERHSGGSAAATGYNILNGKIVDLGERKLNQIKSVPTTGWVEEAAILLKHSYLFCYTGESQDENEGKFSATLYKKVYVVEWLFNKDNEIIGALVQYVDWTPELK